MHNCRRRKPAARSRTARGPSQLFFFLRRLLSQDRKSTRLNSSHLVISYAVFSLKKNTDSPHSVGLGPPPDPRPTTVAPATPPALRTPCLVCLPPWLLPRRPRPHVRAPPPARRRR